MATVPGYDTFLASERVTAAKLNKNIRDNGNFFKGVPFAWAFQGAGVNTVADQTWNNIVLDTERFDNDNMFTVGTPNLTVRTPGLYLIEAGARLNTVANGYRGLRIRVNGIDSDVIYAAASVNTPGNTLLRATTYAQCVAGDVFTADAHTNGAGTASPWTTPVGLAISANAYYYNFLRARWVAA